MRQIAIADAQGRPPVAFYGSDQRQPPVRRQQRTADDSAEREPRPIMTYLLVGINVVVFLMMMKVGHGNIDSVAEMFGAKVNALIQQGQWWRLLTPVFLHGSWLHLLSNSLSLIWFGGGIERLYGARKYLVIYFVAGVVGNLASYMHSPALSLGASGAIFGLVGAGLMFPIRFRSLLPPDAPSKILGQIVPIAAINLFIGLTTPSIDNWAHMGGLVGGALVALFLIPDALQDRQPPRAPDVLLTTACIGLVLLTLLAGFKQWQWAAHNRPMETYQIGTNNDRWWHLGVPTDWKPEGSSVWLSPQGTRLEIIDSVEDPGLLAEDPRLLAYAQIKNKQVKPNIKVDGHLGWQVSEKREQETRDLFIIPIYNRVVELIFDPAEHSNLQYMDAMAQIIRSVHFDHAPQPN